MLCGMDQQMEKKEDGGLYFIDQGWDSIDMRCKDNIMDETHASRYLVHQGADKTYYDLGDMHWWPCMKKDVATYHEIPEWKWDINTMDFITKLPGSSNVAKAFGTRLDKSTADHPQTDGQSERTIQTLKDMLRACRIDFGSSCDTHLPLAESPVLWAKIGESSLIGPELVQETTDKVVLIKEKLKAMRDRQKSYADNRHKPLEFEVRDRVLLKVSPWKGVIELAPRLRDVAVYYHFAISTFPVKIVIRSSAFISEYLLHLPIRLLSASSGSSSLISSKNSTVNMIPPDFSSFLNIPCYEGDVQAFYAKESPISSPDPIISPAILTPSPVLPPSLLFDPRYFFVPEELLPPKKRILYTSTPPQVFEIGKCSDKMYLKHYEKQVKDILNDLDELHLHRIKRMEEERTNEGLPQRNIQPSETPAITLAAIRQLINDGISSALKAQAASMENTDNTNKNTGTSGTLVARKGINNHKRNKIEDKKPSELILPPIDILETFPCVKDVDYITWDLAVSSVRISTLETTLEDIQVSSESSLI
ncbi:putative reverse transcriptase domain-containing protein [Tanacetum coccineum]